MVAAKRTELPCVRRDRGTPHHRSIRDHRRAMSGFDLLIALVMLVGLVGVIIPVLPGLVLIWAAGLAWGVAEGGAGAWAVVALLTILGGVGLAATSVLAGRRAARAGAPGWVLAAGAAGTVVGFFVIPVVGALVGGPAAMLVAEIVRLRDLEAAWRSTAEVLKGVGIGVLVQFVAGVAMIAVWAIGAVAI
jgi:uncharacterized protein YqgC (DUF456 family)